MISEGSPELVVTARRLSKRYGARVAVDAVDFEIRRGCCFGFLGPNGAGKTTTLRMILGLTPISAGMLSVFDLPVPDAARRVRARVGVVPQGDNLDPDFSVAENLHVYASYFGLPRHVVETRIPQLLDFAALSERADAKTEALSGGMKRRLTIARALINEPEMVFCDEPTGNLDTKTGEKIHQLILELNRETNISFVLVTHDESLASLAHRRLRMVDGLFE